MTGGQDKFVFLTALQSSLDSETFVRMTLGKYRGQGDVQKIVVTPVTIKTKPHLKIVTSHARKDLTQNFPPAEAIQKLGAMIGDDFLSATLFTTVEDVTLSYTKKKATTLTHGKPTFSAVPAAGHDREKQHIVDVTRLYLKELGVTMDGGTVKPSMYPKFKQISHFVEIVDQLLRDSELRTAGHIRVTDIGSGKGYLTFALYDHVTGKLGKSATVTGIDVRADMVTLCNAIAQRCGFSGLQFEAIAAGKVTNFTTDVMIALHACDTATDDAIFQGIKAGAGMIVMAPCCQHELAPQIAKAVPSLDGLLKFGLFKQRQADLVTDAARCLLLEASGYRVKVIEFVSTEHTSKNILIAAILDANIDCDGARKQYAALKAEMGFTSQHLEILLENC